MGQFADLKALLEANADKEMARGQAAYMRNQFKFYGIKTPQRRSLTQNLIKATKRAAKVEWDFLDAEQREYQYFVCDYLKAMQGQLVYADLKRLELYVQTKQWWDTIDVLDTVIGQIGLSDKRVDQLMLDWSQASDFWLRRIAIDHQRGRKEKTKQELLAKIIDNNLNRGRVFY
ncbi:DNA alkylation repair protein [Ligilactobacillus agilis DSM 20509]|uniref:DNA alkylation repair protein n=1 Tax=Ligilactobacillus agilis DSM 20509 TaxID=1423718 RepID=A0A0R2ANE2_9LACO|nr:DNA alkylation repair protein [Ligilactobacillus agilis DSM 20509]